MTSDLTTVLSSRSQAVNISRSHPTVLIGEWINPAGHQRVLEALRQSDYDVIRAEARRQVQAGASVLDVNASVPGEDETALLKRVVETVMDAVDVPLCIDTADPEALVSVLDIYEGKALVNSVTGSSRSLDAILPVVVDHKAAVIGLCMDEHGIPDEPQERLRLAERIINRATKAGIALEDIIIDPLAVAMGAESHAGRIALETTALVVKEFGVNITMGVSNISFGMPGRQDLNAAFVSMAIHAGLTCPITNPLDRRVFRAVMAADLAMARDEYGLRWVRFFRSEEEEMADSTINGGGS